MKFFRQVGSAVLLLGSVWLSGCAMQDTAGPAKNIVGLPMQGVMMGGQQPISGATVQVIAIGKTGYGSQGTELANTATDANGNFSFAAGSYTCPTADSQIILTARGGNPGLPGTVNNTAIYLMAIAGRCGDITASTRIDVNEVTTVVSAYVLRPFVTGNNVGVSSANAFSFTMAVAMYRRLVDNSGGHVPGTAPAGMQFSAERINSLANVIAGCVNTSSPDSSQCHSLLAATGTPVSGGQANTFAALHNVASNPSASVASIFMLSSPLAPFQPSLASAPPDWSLPIVYTMGNLSNATPSFDVDYASQIWVATKGGFAGTLELMSNDGTLLKTGMLNGTLDSPAFVTATADGHILVGSNAPGDSSVIIISEPSNTQSGSIANATNNPLNAVEYDFGKMAAADSNGVVWTDPASQPAGLGGGRNYMAQGPDGNLYLSAKDSTFVTTYNPITIDFYNYNLKTGCQFVFGAQNIYCIAPGQNHLNLLVAYSSNLTEQYAGVIDPAGGDGEVDGDGALWLPTVDALNNSAIARKFATPDVYTDGTYVGAIQDFFAPFNRVRIDAAGNVWATSSSGGLYEIVGAAAPTTVPMNRGALHNTLGVRP